MQQPMQQEERLDYLIQILQEQVGNMRFAPAKNLAEKKDIFRALMNVWQGKNLPDTYFTLQDEYLPLHMCIDNAIHSFAGLQLRIKCREIIAAQGHEEETGQAKITPAYNLPCRYVIHTVGPVVGQRLTKRDEDLLCSCYRSCLRQAAANKIKSLAFCCISTGVFHFPNQRAGELAVQTVKACQKEFAPDVHVIFNVFKDVDLAVYTKLLQG